VKSKKCSAGTEELYKLKLSRYDKADSFLNDLRTSSTADRISGTKQDIVLDGIHNKYC
jgi:hypothetical protein